MTRSFGETPEQVRWVLTHGIRKFQRPRPTRIADCGRFVRSVSLGQGIQLQAIAAGEAVGVGERSERELIASFSWTGSGRSHLDWSVSMARLSTFLSFDIVQWYTDDAVDLCDVLSSFSSQGKATLHELCRVMGLPGKPDGMNGAEVEKYYRDGHVRQIAEYCESDVLNTYRVWLRYELFRGRLLDADFQASEANLVEFVRARGNAKPHLAGIM
jgi:hypothetical protein